MYNEHLCADRLRDLPYPVDVGCGAPRLGADLRRYQRPRASIPIFDRDDRRV